MWSRIPVTNFNEWPPPRQLQCHDGLIAFANTGGGGVLRKYKDAQSRLQNAPSLYLCTAKTKTKNKKNTPDHYT